MTEQLIADNLSTQVRYAKAVMAAEPDAVWSSINANHMLPSGSSLFHPHLQGIVDSEPTTAQRMLVKVPAARFEAYVEAERRDGERRLGNTGRVEWIAAFAPVAPAELRAFVHGVASPVELDEDLLLELARGLATSLHAYAAIGYECFNLAIYGAPPGTEGYQLNLRLGARSNLKPFYRSDSTFLERLHWEGAIDVSPEDLAAQIRDRF
jgi:galactose-1-phosphate uridylyltransferase